MIKTSVKLNIIAARLALLFLVILGVAFNTAEARPEKPCPSGHSIHKTFSSNAAWDLCWEVRDEEGVVLSEIYYQPVGKSSRRIMGEASLSQIQTEYDDGSPTEFLVTDPHYGLGGHHLETLTQNMCDGGQLHNLDGRSVLCEVYKPAGYIYRYDDIQRQGNKLDVFSVSKVGSREYIIRWSFLENGTIHTDVGITGQFTKTSNNEKTGWKVGSANEVMASFVDHFFWKLDFDLAGDNADDIIEEIKSVPTLSRREKYKQTRRVSTEIAASFVPAEKKFWRVLDEKARNYADLPISYEMVMLNYAEQSKGNKPSPWLKNDIYITRYHECERFAVQNKADGCGANVREFVNAENTNAKDIVVWYRMVHHTIPRDEDFYPVVPQWTGFILLPRDWTSDNRL